MSTDVPPTPTQLPADQPVPSIDALTAVASEFKKGYKTTEFWVAALAAVIPAVAWLAKLFGFDIDTAELAAATTALVPSLFYIFNRGWVKKQRNVTVAEAVKSAGSSVITPEFIQSLIEAIDRADRDKVDEAIADLEDLEGEDEVDTMEPPNEAPAPTP